MRCLVVGYIERCLIRNFRLVFAGRLIGKKNRPVRVSKINSRCIAFNSIVKDNDSGEQIPKIMFWDVYTVIDVIGVLDMSV